ncbi:alpha/beta hydrolase [Microvirga makkahensis]|uniref:Alpha/beta hydrolase fold domain-containing protein n=1 Tax=Microvirga makkahensis TaxID=1128670 RepID=A0A7X3SMU3_9HYPH|nr:alpha/beta hydrolase [Microvirga makkahensis]MXQ10656.1 alpha/beta hydrolase fold domain-containing protein [Microvirga makkahensis]
MLYRGMDKIALDAAYDNPRAVGLSRLQEMMAGWIARSRDIASSSRFTEIRYGEAERNRIDVFEASRDSGFQGRATLAFIHGGYWRSQDKETYRFLAKGALEHGLNFANIEYTLAPQQTLGGIVQEIREAIACLNGHVARIVPDHEILHISGHSAGGHLVAMNINEEGVASATSISGIFDLEPIRLTYLNEALRLTPEDVARYSPQHHIPASSRPLVIAYGAEELPELCRQSEDFHAAWKAGKLASRLVCLPRHDHFSILEELADPEGLILKEIVQACRVDLRR